MVIGKAALAALVMTGAAMAADVGREGTGPRRVALDKMELTAFDAGLWGKLGAWSGGEALSAANTGGSVVLICTWSSWYQPSVKQGLPVAQKLADRYGSKGLIVVGVHHPQGWDQAAATATAAGAKFVQAHDASGEFRKALQVDQDPDFYVVDRAGHLRYADVATASVEEAVAELVAETREQASDLPRLRTERDAAARASAAANVTIRSDVELSSLPAVPPGYDQPEEEAYTRMFIDVLWPRESRENQRFKDMGLLNQDGAPITGTLNIAPDTFPEGFDPNAVSGRVIVVYFWHPDVRESYAVFDQMDALQRQHPRDLLVIGACTPRQNLEGANSQFNNGQQPAETIDELERKFKNFQKARKFDHLVIFDPGATAALSWPQNANTGGSQNVPLPRGMIASSDGVVRFFGSAQFFRSWLDRVVQLDPGVQRRRVLDELYLRQQKK